MPLEYIRSQKHDKCYYNSPDPFMWTICMISLKLKATDTPPSQLLNVASPDQLIGLPNLLRLTPTIWIVYTCTRYLDSTTCNTWTYLIVFDQIQQIQHSNTSTNTNIVQNQISNQIQQNGVFKFKYKYVFDPSPGPL